MTVPNTPFGVAALLVLVLPGVVWTTVRVAVRGRLPQDSELSNRVLQAVVVSAVLDALYVVVLDRWAVSQLQAVARAQVQQPRTTALAFLFLAVAVPAAMAYGVHGKLRLRALEIRGLRWLRVPMPTLGHASAPTAWDSCAPSLGGHWVRVRIAPGKWVGGWFGNGSYISTYPEPRDIYIEDQHHMDPGGAIGAQVPGTAGLWLSLRDGDVVEWINP